MTEWKFRLKPGQTLFVGTSLSEGGFRHDGSEPEGFARIVENSAARRVEVWWEDELVAIMGGRLCHAHYAPLTDDEKAERAAAWLVRHTDWRLAKDGPDRWWWALDGDEGDMPSAQVVLTAIAEGWEE